MRLEENHAPLHWTNGCLITIEVNITNVVVAVVLSALSVLASVLATWYFSKRHYMRTPLPVTENEIKLKSNQNEFLLYALIFVLLFLVVEHF